MKYRIRKNAKERLLYGERLLWFWKLMLVSAMLLISILIWRINTEDIGTKFDYGIKAALFALSGAGILFIGLIPDGRNVDQISATLLRICIRMAGCYIACSSAWFWIQAETNGQAVQLLEILIPIFAIPGMIAVMPLFAFLINLIAIEPMDDK